MTPSPAQKRRPHADCFLDEIMEGKACSGGDPANCPAVKAAEVRRRARAGEWSELEVRDEGGGQRHYLDGQAIHCGAMIEIQALEYKSDDYGEYTVCLQRGRLVRYELAWPIKPTSLDDRVVLYIEVDGHTFTAAGAGKRYRWPRRER